MTKIELRVKLNRLVEIGRRQGTLDFIGSEDDEKELMKEDEELEKERNEIITQLTCLLTFQVKSAILFISTGDPMRNVSKRIAAKRRKNKKVIRPMLITIKDVMQQIPGDILTMTHNLANRNIQFRKIDAISYRKHRSSSHQFDVIAKHNEKVTNRLARNLELRSREVRSFVAFNQNGRLTRHFV